MTICRGVAPSQKDRRRCELDHPRAHRHRLILNNRACYGAVLAVGLPPSMATPPQAGSQVRASGWPRCRHRRTGCRCCHLARRGLPGFLWEGVPSFPVAPGDCSVRPRYAVGIPPSMASASTGWFPGTSLRVAAMPPSQNGLPLLPPGSTRASRFFMGRGPFLPCRSWKLLS